MNGIQVTSMNRLRECGGNHYDDIIINQVSTVITINIYPDGSFSCFLNRTKPKTNSQS